MKSKAIWLSLHIYVGDQQNNLLKNCIAPTLKALEGTISTFFFIRYWLGGPHIRLRIKCQETDTSNVLRQLEESFSSWKASISDFVMPSYKEYTNNVQRLADLEGVNNEEGHSDFIEELRIVRARYVPEMDKYGGQRGIAIAESLWHKSSLFVLEHIDLLDSHRLILSYKSSLLCVKGFGLNLREALEHFRGNALVWRAYGPENTSESYQAKLIGQAEKLMPIVTSFLVKQNVSEVDASLAFWLGIMKATRNEFELDSDYIVEFFNRDRQQPITKEHLSHFLLTQYIHTHNNRLGVRPIDEWYVASLAAESVERYLISVER